VIRYLWVLFSGRVCVAAITPTGHYRSVGTCSKVIKRNLASGSSWLLLILQSCLLCPYAELKTVIVSYYGETGCSWVPVLSEDPKAHALGVHGAKAGVRRDWYWSLPAVGGRT
jgi:hypothetical protein